LNNFYDFDCKLDISVFQLDMKGIRIFRCYLGQNHLNYFETPLLNRHHRKEVLLDLYDFPDDSSILWKRCSFEAASRTTAPSTLNNRPWEARWHLVMS